MKRNNLHTFLPALEHVMSLFDKYICSSCNYKKDFASGFVKTENHTLFMVYVNKDASANLLLLHYICKNLSTVPSYINPGFQFYFKFDGDWNYRSVVLLFSWIGQKPRGPWWTRLLLLEEKIQYTVVSHLPKERMTEKCFQYFRGASEQEASLTLRRFLLASSSLLWEWCIFQGAASQLFIFNSVSYQEIYLLRVSRTRIRSYIQAHPLAERKSSYLFPGLTLLSEDEQKRVGLLSADHYVIRLFFPSPLLSPGSIPAGKDALQHCQFNVGGSRTAKEGKQGWASRVRLLLPSSR